MVDNASSHVYAPTWYDYDGYQNFDDGSWTCLTDYLPDTASAGQYTVGTYDSARQYLWVLAGGTDSLTAAYWTGSAWVSADTGVTNRQVRMGEYCPDKDCIVLFSQSGNHCIVDCSNPGTLVTLALGAGGPSLSSVYVDGFRWSTNSGKFVYSDDDTGNLWTLSPRNSVISGTWTWAAISTNNAQFINYAGYGPGPSPRKFALADYDDGTVLALASAGYDSIHNVIRLA